MIVISTPTGLIGRQVLENVLGHGERIRVVTRDPSRISPETRGHLEVVQGSLTDVDVVTKAFTGADRVFWLLPPNPRAESVAGHTLDFVRPLCEALTGEDVGGLVYVTGLGRERDQSRADPPGRPSVDDLVAATGVNYRALACPAFMDNLSQQIEPIRSHGMFSYPISGDRALPTCATRDIAAVAANLLLDRSWAGRERLPILGPEDLSYDDMARIMSEVLGRPIRYQRVSEPTFKATLTRLGMAEAWAQGLVDRMARVDQGLYNAEPRTPNSTTPTSFRRWCEEVLRPAVDS